MNTEVVRVEVAKLELKPGDTLLLKLPLEIPVDSLVLLKDALRKNLPTGVGILILDLTSEVQVLSSTEEHHAG